MTRIALVAVFAMGLLLVPAFNSTGTVLAQRGQKSVDNGVGNGKVTTEMIARAVRLGSAKDVTVFSENGVTDKGVSNVKGNVLSLTDGGSKALQARTDISDSFSAINQLPCTEVADTDLSGKTFGPGIYCMASARLAGQVTLDGQGNPDSFFIFRVKGSVTTEKGSAISVIGDAFVNAVYFVSDDSATIGEGTNFKGNIYARNSIVVNQDAIVEGRTLSLKGDVSLNGNAILGPEQLGVLQICKELDPPVGSTPGSELVGRIFRFQIGGPNSTQIEDVLAGFCSRQIPVPTGPGLLVEELLTGVSTNGVGFNGGFQMISVVPHPNSQTPASVITSRNLPLRQFVLNIPTTATTTASQVRILVTNRAAITGIIEICKEGLDNGVNTFFFFSIAEVVDSNGTVITFQAPTGQCTGPISVSVPAIPGGILTPGQPRTGVVNITESFAPGQIFSGATAADGTVPPTNRLLNVNLATRTVRAVLVEGGVTSQTTIFFFNRTLGQLKICKVAGPGIAPFTPFNFAVSGTGPSFAPGVNGNDPGTQTATVVTVPAGTITQPICEDVPLTFLTGTQIQVTELTSAVSSGPGSVETRVARITSNSPIQITPTGANQTNPFFPANSGAASTRTVFLTAQFATTEVEYVNVAFLPVPIKVCKIAGGSGSLLGTTFTFDATTGTTTQPAGAGNPLEDPNDIFGPVRTGTATVIAGPAGIQNGFCDFIAGPATFPLINGLGSFNLFQPVTITERAVSSPATVFVTTQIFTPNNTPAVITNLATRQAFIPQLFNGVNEVVFVNQATVAGLPANKTKRFRMQF